MNGLIYIGYDASKKGFKIGKTNNARRREREIQHMNPTFKILAYAPVPNMNDYEKHFHKKYEDKRIVGEWFSLSLIEVSELLGGKITPEEIEIMIGVGL